MRGPLALAWGQFLSRFSWDWFVSLTFRGEVKSFRAHRLFGYFVRDLEKDAGIPIFWFRADEIGPQGGPLSLACTDRQCCPSTQNDLGRSLG